MKFYGDDIDEYEMYDLDKDPHESTNVFNDPNYFNKKTVMK